MNKRKDLYSQAQTMLEYLLVMVVVVVIVFVAFRKSGNGILEQTQNKTAEYFDTGATAIMGGYYDGTTFVRVEPNKVDGGWCKWSDCVGGYQQRECACPRPAFGGAACSEVPEGAVRAGDCGGEACWKAVNVEKTLLLECGSTAGQDCWCNSHPKEPWDECPSGYQSDGGIFHENKASCQHCTIGFNCWREKGQKWCKKETIVSHCAGDACTINGESGSYDKNRTCVPPKKCPAGTVNNCQMPEGSNSSLSMGTCTNGTVGSCGGFCLYGAWQGVTGCGAPQETPPSPEPNETCAAGSVGNCSWPAGSGGLATCLNGTSGTCIGACISGSWQIVYGGCN